MPGHVERPIDIPLAGLMTSTLSDLPTPSRSDSEGGPGQRRFDMSLERLFSCMALAYSGKLAAPNFRAFRGVAINNRDKMRLNNIIWREWHAQFVSKRTPKICSFQAMVDDPHSNPKVIVMEGKYWKRSNAVVAAEYMKWRVFNKERIRSRKDDGLEVEELLTRIAARDAQEVISSFVQNQGIIPHDNVSPLPDSEYRMDLSDDLFSALPSVGFPHQFLGNNNNWGFDSSEFMQPGLVGLEPDFGLMSAEPLQDLLSEAINFHMESIRIKTGKRRSGAGAMEVPEKWPKNVGNATLMPDVYPINTAASTDPTSTILASTAGSKRSNKQRRHLSSSQTSPLATPTGLMVTSVASLQTNQHKPATSLFLPGDYVNSCHDQGVMSTQCSVTHSQGAFGFNELSTANQNSYDRDSDLDRLLMAQGFLSSSEQQVAYTTGSDINPLSVTPGSWQQAPIITNNSTHLSVGYASKQQRAYQETVYQTSPKHKSPSRNLCSPPPVLPQMQLQQQSIQHPQMFQQPRTPQQQYLNPQQSLQQSLHAPQQHPTSHLQHLQTLQQRQLSPLQQHNLHHPQTLPQTQQQHQNRQQQHQTMHQALSGQYLQPPRSSSVCSPMTRSQSVPAVSNWDNSGTPSQSYSNSNQDLLQMLLHSDTDTSTVLSMHSPPVTQEVSSYLPPLPVPADSPVRNGLPDESTYPIPLSVHHVEGSVVLADSPPMTGQQEIFKRPPPRTGANQEKSSFLSHLFRSDDRSELSVSSPPFSDIRVDAPAAGSSTLQTRKSHRQADVSSQSDADQQEKKEAVTSEQKRREQIRSGFGTLQTLLPIQTNSNTKPSKILMMSTAVEYVAKLQAEQVEREKDLSCLTSEINELNEAIKNCQSKLPANGIVTNTHHNEQMKCMLKSYVKERTLQNWKFYILSKFIEPQFESFTQTVSTANMAELSRSTQAWLDQHCSLPALRQGILQALRELGTDTSILVEPTELPQQIIQAIHK